MNSPEPPAPSRPTRIFLSYARKDDEPFVRRLYEDLTQAGFKVWFDRKSLMSRGLTFHQEIRDAIRTEVDRVIYVGGPNAVKSANVREEWQLALEFDHVVVTPVLRLGNRDSIPGELQLLQCEDFRDDAQYPPTLAKLIASLRLPNPKLGALFAVPNLPPHFLTRPELMQRVRDALLVDLQTAQVITSADARVGMQGMGGIGKSVLAAALARNRQVRESYPDGIVWISFGQQLSDADLVARQRDVARYLGGDGNFDSLAQGKAALRELLHAKSVLLVLDDVWRAADALAFDELGPRGRMLVTTRDAGILHALHGELVPVSLFTEPEALKLLADAVGVEVAALPDEARQVSQECGLLPLALALSGGMAKKRNGDFGSVLERLRRADLEKIADRESINEQHRSIWRAMQASVEMLPEAEQRRFAELSVFATDQTVPEAAAATLWSHTGDLDDLDTEELLINLAERSLVQLEQEAGASGKPQRHFTLHDLLRDYATRIAGEPRALHQALVDSYRKKCPDGWHTGPNDGYFFTCLCHHLNVAGCTDEQIILLTYDPNWMTKQFVSCVGYGAYLSDLNLATASFIDPLAPDRLVTFVSIWIAKLIINERTRIYDNRDLETLVFLGYSALAINHARLLRPCERFWGLLTVYCALMSQGTTSTDLLTELHQAALSIREEGERCKAVNALAAAYIQAGRVNEISALTQTIGIQTGHIIDGKSKVSQLHLAQPAHADALVDLPFALNGARAIKYIGFRICALCAIAGALSKLGDERAVEVFDEAIRTSSGIRDSEAIRSQAGLARALVQARYLAKAQQLAETWLLSGDLLGCWTLMLIEMIESLNPDDQSIIGILVDRALERDVGSDVTLLSRLGVALNLRGDSRGETLLRRAEQVARNSATLWEQGSGLSALANSLARAKDPRAERLLSESHEAYFGVWTWSKANAVNGIATLLFACGAEKCANEIERLLPHDWRDITIDLTDDLRPTYMAAAKLARQRRFVAALNLLGSDRLDTVIFTLTEWAPTFESVSIGLALATLREATRVASWVRPDWSRIHRSLGQTA